MGHKRAIKAINLEETDKIPHWETIANPEFEEFMTGIDPYRHPIQSKLKLIEKLDLDIHSTSFLIDSSKRPTKWKKGESIRYDDEGNPVVRWGTGTTWRWSWGQRFKSVEEVLGFNPSEIKNDPYIGDLTLSPEELAKLYDERYRKTQELVDERCLVVDGYYKTLFMWPLMTFGWRLFMKTLLEAPKEFKKLLDKFALISQKVFQAWAMTDIELIYSHDDLCVTRGPIFSPEWYRKYIYPWYKKFWEPLKRKGIKILFISDGNVDAIVDDVFEAGADGLLLDHYANLKRIVDEYGDNKFFMGGIDGRILLHKNKKDIWSEVERVTKLVKDCRGYFYSGSSYITHNVPIENISTYFKACNKLGTR